MRPDSVSQLDDSQKNLQNHVNTGNATLPRSLRASISPPPSRIRRSRTQGPLASTEHQDKILTPDLAAIEAGRVQITDHLVYFSTQLLPLVRKIPSPNGSPRPPRLSNNDWKNLYERNQDSQGRHWVIHQHDHPVAGVHYDLRLQISKTSSISWAIMYGLPGNANSRRLNRNATETRVHNLWVGVYSLNHIYN